MSRREPVRERKADAISSGRAISRRRARTIAGRIAVVLALVGAVWVVVAALTDAPQPNKTASEAPRGVGVAGEGRYDDLRAHGAALRVLRAARKQMNVKYVYGAQPRDPDGLDAIGRRKHRAGFDCSSFVAYAFLAGTGDWISGRVAHTDEIWTQGGELPLTPTPGETSKIIRGTGRKPPPGGYRPGDILEVRGGAGGYWGHVVIVSEGGRVIQSYPPDVYETDSIEKFLTRNNRMGWVRVKALGRQ